MRERGLKFVKAKALKTCGLGRSREGARIEIIILGTDFVDPTVAPVRERGLKFE